MDTGLKMSDAQSWYIQTTFGLILGPMPEDCLRQMALSGELSRDDLIRRDAASEWVPASDLPSLFDANRVGANAVVAALSSPTQESTLRSLAMSAAPVIATPLPASSNPIDIVTQDAAESQTRPDEVSVAETRSELPTIPESAIPLPSTTDVGNGSVESSWNGTRPLSRRPSLATGTRPKVDARAAKPLPIRNWAIATLLVFVAAWWFWPRPDRRLCDRLQAIRSELIERKRKSSTTDIHDLKKFTTQAIAELDARMPALETKAKTGHQESLYLLLASRDCLKPMLANATETQKALEENLDYFLWALKNYYDGYQALEVLPDHGFRPGENK